MNLNLLYFMIIKDFYFGRFVDENSYLTQFTWDSGLGELSQNIKQGQVAVNIFKILFFRLGEQFPGVFFYFILFLTEQCQASLSLPKSVSSKLHSSLETSLIAMKK